MDSIKELRELARDLQEKNIWPPYFMKVDEAQARVVQGFSSFVKENEYGDNCPKYRGADFELGACEHFRFIMTDRRETIERRNK